MVFWCVFLHVWNVWDGELIMGRMIGEEAGLLGSQAIAASYKTAGKTVRAMFNLDMIA